MVIVRSRQYRFNFMNVFFRVLSHFMPDGWPNLVLVHLLWAALSVV